MKTPEKIKESKPLTTPDSFYWNDECPDYGRVNAGNLRKFGFSRKGRQRRQCTTCEKVVTETRGTVFHGKHHSEETIIECLAMLADRNSLAAIQRVKGIKEETVSAWVTQVAPQMEQIEELLLKDHKLGRAQLDALSTYLGHKGEKKGFEKKTSAARSGAARRSQPTPGSASGGPSPRPKKKSPKN